MSAPSKACAIQSVKIQPEERLATTSELNLTPSSVTNCREAKGMGYWATTQVKGLSSEIYHRVGGRHCVDTNYTNCLLDSHILKSEKSFTQSLFRLG